MSKIAIVTDSNSGLTQEQGEKLGINVIPMPFIINNETYYEDINLSQKEFYEYLSQDADISTTQPSPDTIMTLWDRLLEENDFIVHIPMSSGLSGSCDTARMLAMDYDGKVLVVNNQRISVTQRASAIDARNMADSGIEADKICEILEAEKFESSIYIMVDTLKYLKKGGRITAAAAALGTILKLKPVLTIQGEKLDAFAKARTITQAKNIMTKAIKEDIDTRLGGASPENMHIAIAHTENLEAAENLREELLKVFPEHDIYIDHLSLSISCHIGPGSLAIACSKVVNF